MGIPTSEVRSAGLVNGQFPNLTVGQLKELLADQPDDALVVLASDPDATEFRPLAQISVNAHYVPGGNHSLNDLFNQPMPGSVQAVGLWPNIDPVSGNAHPTEEPSMTTPQVGKWRYLHTGGGDTDVYTADVTVSFSLRAFGGAPLGNVREALMKALAHVEFEVQTDPAEDPNGFTTVEVHV